MSRVAVLLATLALALSACSGDADDYVSPLTDADLAPLNEQVEELPTKAELAAIEDNAPDDEPVEEEANEESGDEAAEEAAASPIPTLPGQGATLSPDAQAIGHWQYYPAKAWTLTNESDESVNRFTTTNGTAEVRVRDASPLSAQGQVGLISDQVAASHGEVEIYDSGTYEHTNGYEVVWVRFDAIQDNNWTPGQRFWILSEEATFEIELMGDDATTFDDDLFALQGVVNEVDCPDKA